MQLNWLWIVRGAVEIGILAVGIFYAFQYLQRTRGWPVVVGFLLLLGLTLKGMLQFLEHESVAFVEWAGAAGAGAGAGEGSSRCA